MKKIIFFIFIFAVSNSIFAQKGSWTSLSYTHSNGPVSPEYQYSYTIVISNEGSGIISYRKNTTTQEKNFNIGKNGLKELNAAIIQSGVLTLSPDIIKSDRNLMGGPETKMIITLWQAPNLDAKPPTIEIPNQLNPEYSAGILNLYYTIEMLVPSSVWNNVSK